MQGKPGTEAPQASYPSVSVGLDCARRCIRYQIGGSVMRKCGSLQRIALPVAERCGAITQLLLPWPAGCQSLPVNVPLTKLQMPCALALTARVIVGPSSG